MGTPPAGSTWEKNLAFNLGGHTNHSIFWTNMTGEGASRPEGERGAALDEFAEVVFRVPAVPTLYAPLLTVVPLQIFACELASVKGLDVDQPRNLAKSVTVE